ncbi:TetR/AcrR family transcriptional regulator [Tatumella sp. TA1]|uniref:TetR/AcrR family transcriptional regulator n=1 Tax=Rosenbergiella collisarenosi TaxID=1544695 RepID=UPI0008F8AA2D|nr:TetR/AcrR family transcriptional regulator [Rosenbergiella collisarenosi]MBT0721041.1 TetR/AcrR family transcriptional regulator [Rosenbergiella collisarenosi]QGX91632.1 TetR/AcrR family transcriptional regulator [Tatumella sp. TA1]
MSAKQKIRDAAHTLFYNQGIHATGIDSIIKRAGVAKQSFYNHYTSKQELVLDYLDLRHQQWLDLYALRLQHATSARDRILAVYDAYQDHAEHRYENGFRGCGLLNAAAEFPVASPERQRVAEQKAQIQRFIEVALADLKPTLGDQAGYLAQEFAFLLEGSISLAGLTGHSALITQAKASVEQRLEVL